MLQPKVAAKVACKRRRNIVKSKHKGGDFMELGKRIAKLRQDAGFSQEKLAEMLDVSRQAVTKWESGKSNPDTENLLRLAEIFGCSIDELCGNGNVKEPKKPSAKIHAGGHILTAVSLLIVAAYCVIGGAAGTFRTGTLVLLLIMAVPMQALLHLVFCNMVKSGEFSMLAGYDSNVKYDTEALKRYIAGLDFLLGFETVSYLFMLVSVSLIAPQLKIIPVLLFGYIISFITGIFFMGYKFGDRIYADPEDAKKAKRGMPSVVILMGVILLSVIAFIVFFEIKGYQNNSAESFPLLVMMFLSIILTLTGYFNESKRLKKADEHAPLFGKTFIVLNVLALGAMVLMAVI